MKYSYSSLHVVPPDALSQDIVLWGKNNVHDDEIYVKNKLYGREDNIHITVLYSVHVSDSQELKSLLENYGPIDIALGKINVFTNRPKFDVIVIDIVSEELRKLNEFLVQEVKHDNKYGEFKPHLTIAYVKKGRGWKYHKLPIMWEGDKFNCNHLVLSSFNGEKHIIPF